MFKKREHKPVESNLQGEDFDIFPELDDNTQARIKSQNEIEDAIEVEQADITHDDLPDDPEPTDFQKKVAKIPDKKWNQLQWFTGLLLGFLSGFCLTSLEVILGEGRDYGLIVAAVICFLAPRLIESQSARKIPKLRIAMIVALFVYLACFLAYTLIYNPGAFITN